jgi:hypothetical protein
VKDSEVAFLGKHHFSSPSYSTDFPQLSATGEARRTLGRSIKGLCLCTIIKSVILTLIIMVIINLY